jgi:signal transduction histidine kinase
MFSSIKSRLWLGYLLLSLVVIGSMAIGLTIAIARSPVLYREKLHTLRTNETTLIEAIDQAGNSADLLKTIQFAMTKFNSQMPSRVFVLDSSGKTLFDSDAASRRPVTWRSLIAIQETKDLVSFNIVRDTRFVAWIYVGQQLANGDYLVLADLRGNPSLVLLFSDPVVRTVFRVLVIAILLSLLLTFLMERWVSRPIGQIAANAQKLASGKLLPIIVEGPKEVRDLALVLNEMSTKVSESQQSQRDFVSDVSHELKTPLTSITGFSQAIAEGTVSSPAEVKHAAEVIQNEAGRMYRLVTDLLALARLEGGSDSVKLEKVDLAVLVQNILDRFALAAGMAQIKLVNSTQNLPVCITDPDRVTQILNNLLDNAIKFSMVGASVAIGSKVETKSISIMVKDQGIGIAPEDQKKVFDRFYQVDHSRSKSGYSSGLGLPIARQIARNLGGDLVVYSQVGNGSVFTLILPYRIELPPSQNGKPE